MRGGRDPFVAFTALGSLGRLGNQLFQIASTVGIAKSNGCEAVFPPWRGSGTFPHAVQAAAGPIRTVRTFRERTHRYQEVRIDHPTRLLGFFQSELYFAAWEEEIRSRFALRQDLEEELRCHYGGWLNRPTCSLHVRRGDYVNNPFFADLTEGPYYERAMERLAPDTLFVVFSDDTGWCKRRLRGPRFVFAEGLDAGEALLLMSYCRGHIIANSSFSWWGAWLDPRPDKTVVAPSVWFDGMFANPCVPYVPGLLLWGYHDAADIVPARWIRL